MATLTVFHEPDLDEFAVWCDRCLLPAAVRLHFIGMSPIWFGELATRTVCTGCDPELFEDDTDG